MIYQVTVKKKKKKQNEVVFRFQEFLFFHCALSQSREKKTLYPWDAYSVCTELQDAVCSIYAVLVSTDTAQRQLLRPTSYRRKTPRLTEAGGLGA